MNFHDLQSALQTNPKLFLRFVLPDGDCIPAHAHVTEVGHVAKSFVDCGGLTGKEEKVVLQTHVGDDTDHRLRADRFAKILWLGNRVIPNRDLDGRRRIRLLCRSAVSDCQSHARWQAPESDLAPRPDAMSGA